MTSITFAYSPCPNDTFMFAPIFSGAIDTYGLQFDIVHDEVEQLNLAAYERKYDVTKMSFNAFTKLTHHYQLLDAGAALGKNCGPILVARENIPLDQLSECRVAIPGVNTTANLMMSLALPDVLQKYAVLFSDIESAVLAGDYDAGLIIHESRFTYESKGLVKLLDVGEYWEATTHTPIPLGGIAVAKDLPAALKSLINKVVSESVRYAMQHPTESLDYIKAHAQEMDEEVMYSHIELYVNDYSKSLGKNGRKSIKLLFDKVAKDGSPSGYYDGLILQP